MKIKIIKTEEDYKNAIALMEKLGDNPDFEKKQELIDEFELLEKLVDLYEQEKYPIAQGDPIEIIKLKMNYLELTQKDLTPLIGSKGVVSMVLNKKRGLSKNMIRELSILLKINQELLNTKYDLQKDNTSISKNRESLELFKFLRPRGINAFDIQRRVAKRGTTVQMCA